jgi:hypothetical protein
MPSKIVIDGHLQWIIPLLLILATASFTLYTIYPTYEYFSSDNKISKSITDSKDKLDNSKGELDNSKGELDNSKGELDNSKGELDNSKGELDNSKDELDNSKDDLDNSKDDLDNSKDDLDNLQKALELLKNKISRHTDKNKKDIKFSKPEKVKENFESYSTNTGILGKNWMNEKSKKIKNNGSIKGYNCSEYSEYTNTQIDTANYMKPPGQSDYIFPGKPVNKTNCIKYAAKPNILGYENDVNDKILQHESLNILNDYKPEYLNIDRPQYMYNRKSEITNSNY